MDEAHGTAWLQSLSDQYEAYPYPHRDPVTDKDRPVRTTANDLATIAHHLGGGRPLHGQGFRALVAGGGTGDATIHLALQLAEADPDGEVVHVDLSRASMEIARARADVRGLGNIRFELFNLLDLTPDAFGTFDYVNCSGVLHHLPDPVAGLRALRGVLKPTGGMSVMLYGTYGRIGVYHLQDVLVRLAQDGDDLRDLVGLTRGLLASLTQNAWLVRKAGPGPDARSPDAEIVDKYLHPHDKPFTVPEIFAALEAAGLHFAGFIQSLWYDPLAVVTQGTIRARIAAMAMPERAALAEILNGVALDKHMFFAAVATPPAPPDPLDDATCPVLVLDPQVLEKPQVGLRGPRQAIIRSPALDILRAIDGTRSVGALRERMLGDGLYPSAEAFNEAWRETYTDVNGRGLLMLAARDRTAS